MLSTIKLCCEGGSNSTGVHEKAECQKRDIQHLINKYTYTPLANMVSCEYCKCEAITMTS